MRKGWVIVACFFITGCFALQPWMRLDGTKEYVDSPRNFIAMIPDGWMRMNKVPFFIITRDGISLESISVERHAIDKKLEFTKKMYDKNMSIEDLAEIEIDNLKVDSHRLKLEITKNIPLTIAGKEGFRLEYKFTTEDKLKVNGIHCGFMDKKSVYRIRYEAAEMFYFDKYKADFEKFVATFRLKEEN